MALWSRFGQKARAVFHPFKILKEKHGKLGPLLVTEQTVVEGTVSSTAPALLQIGELMRYQMVYTSEVPVNSPLASNGHYLRCQYSYKFCFAFCSLVHCSARGSTCGFNQLVALGMARFAV